MNPSPSGEGQGWGTPLRSHDTLAERAQSMRRNPTEPEKRLWRYLSASQLGGFKFRRQAVIPPYIVDFLCPARAFVVEIDGDTHDDRHDAVRDAALLAQGYATIRFTNQDVMTNMAGVLAAILEGVSSASARWPDGRPHPDPSPEGEGLDCAP